MTGQGIHWQGLEEQFPSELVQELRRYVEGMGPLELTAEDLTSDVGPGQSESALSLLRKIASLGVLTEEKRFLCPNCPERLTQEEFHGGTCPHCEYRITEDEGRHEEISVFVRRSAPSRDVPWVLSLHGMNTRGEWQEEFSWLVSTTYAHSVPVAIYKYGVVRPGAFFRFRQRSLARELGSKIKRLAGTTKGTGFGKRPDVIAHSLGTLLLNTALRSDPSIEIGRVILLGCIVRPDSDWHELIYRGQVEAVLNHYGTKDFWALVAHYFIPGSGPSGRVGFNGGMAAINVSAKGLGHSDFFGPDHLNTLFKEHWRPFLTLPHNELPRLKEPEQSKRVWREAPWLLRATVARVLLIALAIVATAFIISSFAVGISQELDWLMR